MSLIYLLALVGFALVMLAVMIDAVMSVSRKPSWTENRVALREVVTVERRIQTLPYVGIERRAGGVDEQVPETLKQSA